MTSPTIEQAVVSIQLNDYLCLVTITAVGYDYTLTLSKEVEYIWNKPWTWVSTLFVLARYSGLCFTILFAILASSFLPGPGKDNFLGKAIYIFASWNFCIFVFAAELLMILRVRALYNQSRLVLGTLLMFYALEVITFLVYYFLSEVRLGSASGSGTAQVLQYSFCELVGLAPIWLEELPTAAMIALGALMCLLHAIRLVKEILRMYRMTKHVQLNRYIQYLVREGMVYFVVILVFAVLAMLYYITGLNNIAVRLLSILCTVLQSVPPVTLVPRFVLGLRELYMHDLRDGRGNNIDTAFGFGSEVGKSTVWSTIIFADQGGQNDVDEGDEMHIKEVQDVSLTSTRV